MEFKSVDTLEKPENSSDLSKFCAFVAKDRLAKNVLIIDLSKAENSITDYFVLCTGESVAQIDAIYDRILEKCREVGLDKPKSEGTDYKEWILFDFFDVVVHIMMPKIRQFYNIEKIWADGDFLYLNDNMEFEKLDEMDVVKLLKETSE